MKNILLVLLLLPAFSKAQMITTFAGNGTSGYTGEGGSATAAEIANPRGIAIANNGNVYIACWGAGSHVLKVNSFGIISTFAGNGTSGYSGDDVAATATQLNSPTTVAFDRTGNIYIADAANNRIRKVDTFGIISTFAGNGISGNGGDGGPATDAQLNYPAGIAFDAAGNSYIADYYNNKIRKINSSGIISTFAGTGTMGYSGDGSAASSAKLNTPARVVVDVNGVVYIDDYGNNRIRKVNSVGVISLVAGNGASASSGDGNQATAASLTGPVGLFVDAGNTIYIADWGGNRIRRIDASGIINTIAGTGIAGYNGDCIVATTAELNSPIGIALDASNHIFISDYGDNRVRVLSSTCTLGISSIVPPTKELIEVYPNPTSSELTIACSEKITKITITNLLGQTVFTHEYNTEKAEVNVANYPAGIYFVKINGTEVRKFVKQ